MRNGVANALTAVLAVVTIVAGIAATVRPMGNQIAALDRRMGLVESRTIVRGNDLSELRAQLVAANSKLEVLTAEINRLRAASNSHCNKED